MAQIYAVLNSSTQLPGTAYIAAIVKHPAVLSTSLASTVIIYILKATVKHPGTLIQVFGTLTAAISATKRTPVALNAVLNSSNTSSTSIFISLPASDLDYAPKYGILKYYTERSSRGTDIDLSGKMINNDIESEFVAPLSIISNQPQYSSDSLSLKRFSYRQPVQRWEIESNLMPRNDGHFFLMHSVVYGHDAIFDIRMPQQYTGKEVDSSFKTVSDASALSGDSYVTLSNVTNVKRGEFIRFQGHTKVYMIWLVNGNNIYIKPNLVANVSNGAKVYRGGNVVMKAKYDDSTQLGIKYVDGILADPGSVKFIEAL